MKTLATDGCAVLRVREDTSVVQKRFGFSEEQRASVCRDGPRTVHRSRRHWQSGDDDCSDSSRKRRSIRPLLREGKTKTQSSTDSLFNESKTQHYLTQLATLHSKWHELSQKHRSSGISRAATITRQREQNQGSFTQTHVKETGCAKGEQDMTTASRRREAPIVHVQRSVCVTQGLVRWRRMKQ